MSDEKFKELLEDFNRAHEAFRQPSQHRTMAKSFGVVGQVGKSRDALLAHVATLQAEKDVLQANHDALLEAAIKARDAIDCDERGQRYGLRQAYAALVAAIEKAEGK